MPAELFVAADVQARDHCVVVVKGTFRTDLNGILTLSDEQRPLTFTDEYYGDPETSCIRYGCDFVMEKPLLDVLVVGKAVAPEGKAVRELQVRLEIDGRAKDVMVRGERRWVRVWGGLVPSDPPASFVEMPLTFDRAFGGQDDSEGAERVVAERRNLAGVGFHPRRTISQIEGAPLPNLEDSKAPIKSARDRPDPVGFGFLSPAWEGRSQFAGTYDDRWLAEAAPYLPADFDSRYFQSAPDDQRVPFFRGGEVIRCIHMARNPVVEYRIPQVEMPVTFRFINREEKKQAVLDTLVLEPHADLAILIWRASVPLEKKLNTLREILVGGRSPDGEGSDEPIGYQGDKPIFDGLGSATRWLRSRSR